MSLVDKIYEQIEKSESQDFVSSDFVFEDYLIDKEYLKDNKPTKTLIELSYDKFEELIIKYKNMIEIEYRINIDEFFKIIRKNKDSTFTDNETRLRKEFSDFSKKFHQAYKIISKNFASAYIKKKGLTICPYCDRAFINIYKKENSNYVRPDLDHFYHKSKYPFLACVLDNLIPSCISCNERLKHTMDCYEKECEIPLKDDEYIFENIEFYYDNNGIIVENCSNKKVKNFAKYMSIKEQYSIHIDIKEHLKNKLRAYNKIKQKNIKKLCRISEVELENMVFSEYINIEKHKTILWKLKTDLYNKMKN